jgi:hypothetical protein
MYPPTVFLNVGKGSSGIIRNRGVNLRLEAQEVLGR